MKKSLALVAAVSALAGCASVQVVQTPAQVAAQVCPSIQSANSALQVPGVMSNSDLTNLNAIAPVVDKVCADASTIQSAKAVDIKAIADKAVPIVLKAVVASSLPTAKMQEIELGITVAKAALAPAIAQWQAQEASEASAAK